LSTKIFVEANKCRNFQFVNPQQALKMRDDFLSNVSHELRSPLTSIYSFSSIIADGLAGATNEQQDEHLEIIQRNVRQLQSMIEDLLAVTAERTGKLNIQPQDASVSEAILDAVHTAEANATAKGIKLSCVIPPKLPLAFADPIRLLQVLTILCDNAIKFTPSGGLVKVETKVFEKVSGYLLVEVSDTGYGIKPELLGRIFEYLYQRYGVQPGWPQGSGTWPAHRQGVGDTAGWRHLGNECAGIWERIFFYLADLRWTKGGGGRSGRHFLAGRNWVIEGAEVASAWPDTSPGCTNHGRDPSQVHVRAVSPPWPQKAQGLKSLRENDHHEIESRRDG
jgi:hypothetical protein